MPPFWHICFYKSIFILVCLSVTSINIISFIRIFAPFLCCHSLWSFFVVCCCFSFVVSFLFRIHFWPNFISSSNDTVATTAAVEQITKTTRSKPQAPSSSFLAFLILPRSRYIIMQSSFTSFSPKICRLTDLNTNCKWKYDITVY